jgi:L-arabinokinase
LSPPRPPQPDPPSQPLHDDLPTSEPVATLLRRVRADLSADFRADRPIRLSRAPGRLDVMGGIADYTGSLVCEMPIGRAAAVALQERDDSEVQVFSFNLFDRHEPFTLRIPLDALIQSDAEALRREFNEPGRKWAAYLVGCLYLLHEQGYIDLKIPSYRGMNIAILSSIRMGCGVGSSAAVEVATMMNLIDHFGIRRADEPATGQRQIDPLRFAELCQQVEHRIVGAPCGIVEQITSTLGEPGRLLRLLCQPHDLRPPLDVPPGMRFIGINSSVTHSAAGGAYARTRCAAFMAHRMILDKMRDLGRAAGRTLERDPMNGYLANLDPADYKRYFRPFLPQHILGDAFLHQHRSTIDPVTTVQPDVEYAVLGAADHHVLEARRVRNFATFLEEANALPADARERGIILDKAGHLMYASHLSYANDAQLGRDECDLLVDLVRRHERDELYGARITGGGGTIAILANVSHRSDAAIQKILEEYAKRTGRNAEVFPDGAGDGAWQVGTALV